MYKIIFTLLLCCCATAYGAEVDNALLKKNLEAANLQIEVLKAQVEVMKSYQDKFLSTVYWSLGGVLGIVVLLVGYNWFTNFKNQEKEIQTLKNYVEKEFRQKKIELEGSIGQEIKDIWREESKSLWFEVNELQYQFYLAKFNEYKSDQIYSLSISQIKLMISISKKMKYEFRVKKGLDYLVNVLELTLSEKRKSIMTTDLVSIVEEILSMAGDEYAPIKRRANDLISKIHDLN
ncbi:hypothetical protein E0H82_03890 [Acinetobacter sp. ANC 4910]|uniref:hypothetical protein n=1 Tax=Acinetobacter sp. ANC 4910 TaxID=2529850 RepID=UPI00103C0240|nr:hypothetical protein [Acinetobacter sp. ANC 4910]TCB36858.1 hypothetical protein E0H82_03890 [Acinetobacter sp. ANC 4910]